MTEKPEGYRNKYRSKNLPHIRPCEGPCGRMTRPSRWSPDPEQDTVPRASVLHCKKCHREAIRAGEVVAVPQKPGTGKGHTRRTDSEITRQGRNYRVAKMLPEIRKCYGPGCTQMTRPNKMKPEEAPGTVPRRSAFYCGSCGRKYHDVKPAELEHLFNDPAAQLAVRPEEEIDDERVLHSVKGLNRFMAGRQQRELRRANLAKIRNVASPNQPQPRGNGGGGMAAAAHGPRPVPHHQQRNGAAGVHLPGAPGRQDVLQRRA